MTDFSEYTLAAAYQRNSYEAAVENYHNRAAEAYNDSMFGSALKGMLFNFGTSLFTGAITGENKLLGGLFRAPDDEVDSDCVTKKTNKLKTLNLGNKPNFGLTS